MAFLQLDNILLIMNFCKHAYIFAEIILVRKTNSVTIKSQEASDLLAYTYF